MVSIIPSKAIAVMCNGLVIANDSIAGVLLFAIDLPTILVKAILRYCRPRSLKPLCEYDSEATSTNSFSLSSPSTNSSIESEVFIISSCSSITASDRPATFSSATVCCCESS